MNANRLRTLWLTIAALLAVRVAGTQPRVQISMDASSVVRTVDSRIFGVNAVYWDNLFMDPRTTGLLRDGGIQAFRFSGGSLSDQYHLPGDQTALSFDNFAGVARGLGAQVFITCNYGSGTPDQAANWVRYSNVTKGYGLKYWEIGNE